MHNLGVMNALALGLVFLDHRRPWRSLRRDMHRTAADHGTAASAGAKFGKGHFHRHSIIPVLQSDVRFTRSSTSFTHRAASLRWFKRINPESAAYRALTFTALAKFSVNVPFRGCFACHGSRCPSCNRSLAHDMRPAYRPAQGMEVRSRLHKRSTRFGTERAMATFAEQSDQHGLQSVTNGLDSEYRPSPDEPFMNERQLDYFRAKLVAWKDALLREGQDTLNTLQAEPMREPDITDRASSETDWSIELRTRDRQRKLISKIDSALRRIEDGEYGYCDVTGEPISLKRLEARPIATMTLEAQEKHERQEKVSRDE